MSKNILIGMLAFAVLVLGFLFNKALNKVTELQNSNLDIQQVEETEVNEEEISGAEFSAQMDRDFQDAGTWQKLRCTPTARLTCNGTQCAPAEPVVYLNLNKQTGFYSRCDSKSCDDYQADFNVSGMYTNIQAKYPMGNIIKVLGNREYIEVVTIGLSSSFSSGICFPEML